MINALRPVEIVGKADGAVMDILHHRPVGVTHGETGAAGTCRREPTTSAPVPNSPS
jgi:hypothetical protein